MHFFIYHKKEQASIPVPLSSDIAKNFSIIWINDKSVSQAMTNSTLLFLTHLHTSSFLTVF